MLFAILLLAAVPETVPTPEPSPALTAGDIIDRVRTRNGANALAREGLAWTKTEITTDIDDSRKEGEPGRERVKETEVWRMWARGGQIWQRRIWRNGKPDKADRKPEHPKADLSGGLLSWYTYRLAEPPLQKEDGTACEAGTPCCWALLFTPSGDAKTHGLAEEVAARLEGTMYIDEHGFWLRSAAGHLSQPYQKKVLFVSVASAGSVEMKLEQAEQLGAVMLRRLSLTFHYSFLLVGSAERDEIIYSDFGLAANDPRTQTPPS